MKHPRKVTCRIIDLMDDGVYDPRMIAEIALDYLAESEVAHMARLNELTWALNDDDEQWDGE